MQRKESTTKWFQIQNGGHNPSCLYKKMLAGNLYCSPSPPHFVAEIWRRIYGVVPAEEGSVICCAFRAWFDYMQSLLGILNPGAFIRKRPLHTNAFTQWRWYGQMRLHADPLTRRHLWHTQAPAHTCGYTHTDACTHGRFYNQLLLLHTQALPTHTQTLAHTFTHWPFYTRANALTHGLLSHTAASAHPRLHTDALTHTRRQANTQALLHADALTHRCFHTGAFAHARKFQKKNYLFRFQNQLDFLI